MGNVVLNLADGQSEQNGGFVSELEEGGNECCIKPFVSCCFIIFLIAQNCKELKIVCG